MTLQTIWLKVYFLSDSRIIHIWLLILLVHVSITPNYFIFILVSVCRGILSVFHSEIVVILQHDQAKNLPQTIAWQLWCEILHILISLIQLQYPAAMACLVCVYNSHFPRHILYVNRVMVRIKYQTSHYTVHSQLLYAELFRPKLRTQNIKFVTTGHLLTSLWGIVSN